jgi:acetyltransferase-like isoleucine patch superfamily enzyme
VRECPVDIEHVDTIVDLRRHLVMAESRFPSEAGALLRGVEGPGENPWGQPQSARMDWAEGLEGIRVLQPGDPAPEYLFWVGCAGAFDERAREATRSIARLLSATGTDFAVLGRKPKLAKSSTAGGTVDLPGLVLGDECSVGSHTVLMSGTTIGARTIVGDNAGVRERCRIGDDVVVGRSVTVENDTTIGDRVKMQSGAYVTAYVVIEDDVFIAPMVVTTNDNFMGRTTERFKKMRGATIRRGARVGGGVHILPGIEIGEEAFVATGAVVTRDVPARTLVMGVPAKPVRAVPEDELLENQ